MARPGRTAGARREPREGSRRADGSKRCPERVRHDLRLRPRARVQRTRPARALGRRPRHGSSGSMPSAATRATRSSTCWPARASRLPPRPVRHLPAGSGDLPQGDPDGGLPQPPSEGASVRHRAEIAAQLLQWVDRIFEVPVHYRAQATTRVSSSPPPTACRCSGCCCAPALRPAELCPFSVVVVAHDSAVELTNLLDSVDRHLDPPPQLILVDTASGDDTLAVWKERRSLCRWIRTRDSGPPATPGCRARPLT